jgi:hypothetical protein
MSLGVSVGSCGQPHHWVLSEVVVGETAWRGPERSEPAVLGQGRRERVLATGCSVYSGSGGVLGVLASYVRGLLRSRNRCRCRRRCRRQSGIRRPVLRHVCWNSSQWLC